MVLNFVIFVPFSVKFSERQPQAGFKDVHDVLLNHLSSKQKWLWIAGGSGKKM